ncbi:unnamed protein product, partial [Heterosigma akashiwo]
LNLLNNRIVSFCFLDKIQVYKGYKADKHKKMSHRLTLLIVMSIFLLARSFAFQTSKSGGRVSTLSAFR